MPTRRLPSDPNLEQLRNQAKTLQRRVRAADTETLALARELHPRLADGLANAAELARGVRKLGHAAGASSYSWMRPPRRSRRYVPVSVAEGSPRAAAMAIVGSGGWRSSARCGLPQL